ncbi:ABC transporter substrate-binding protein [Phototrophicus methaneseepsis]|uniref:ABC transporter substrate-binding protein n=1 Tax=Phototrophicus methaneseepsis TaxID=2710758 RepID=A0A7S8ICL1_9CHLR|nr:ABC transporter substrate-binding protein [Phototrophicus methaneseepsis]QPC80652.1 ABC transporter substrate-binding protein [Phototrophicus methaneseepsis]
MRWVSKLRILVVVLAIFLGALAIQAQDETILVVGHAENTDSLDPAHGYTQTTGIVNRATYNTLVTFPDADASEILPMLATEWTISEDGTEYTFTLRDDVTFASGNPLTAEDVVFSVERLQNVMGNPSFLAEGIESVVANEDGTVTFTLATPRPSFLAELTNYAFSITDSATIMENGGTAAEDAAETDTAEDYLNGTSAGTGPYILDGWEQDVETILVKNPNYWGEEPYFDRVIITNIPEAATQKIALEAGDIDLALDLSRDQTATMEGNENLIVYSGPGVQTHFLLMNEDPELGGPVSDPLVQKAIRYALDYEGYKALWGGVTPATNLTVGLAGAYGEDQALSRDLDMARELLAEAGYADGFEITLSYPDYSSQGVNMNTNAQKIQSDLAEIGITVTLNTQELQVSLEEYRNGLQGFGYWFWGPDVLDPVDVLSFLPGGKVAEERANWTTEGVDEEILALIDAASTETDPAARVEIFAQLQDYLKESSPFAPFINPAIQAASRADLQGFVFHPQWGVDVSILSLSE